MTTVHVDLESSSAADLRKVGVYRYAEHPSTRVLCMSYRIRWDNDSRDGPVQSWRPGMPVPEDLARAIEQDAEVWAWNANFERVMWRLMEALGFPAIRLGRWRCTMVKAAVHGLPLGLDMCGEALGLPPEFAKSKDGHNLMMRMARPRAANADGTYTWWHEDEPLRLLDLMMYCAQDVEAESKISEVLGDMPGGWDWWVEWCRDQVINDRGVPLDLDLISRMQVVAANQLRVLDSEMAKETGGAVTKCSQRQRIFDWVNASHIVTLPDLKAKTVSQALAGTDVPQGTALRRVLELREEAAKSSVSKLKAMEACVCDDGRVRGGLQYYGANRTGRWAGRLVQWHNMPRPVIKAHEIKQAIEMILNRDMTVQEMLTGLGAFMGASVMACLSSLLRGCLAGDDWMGVLDFAQIEARVLAWLAGQQDILDVFAKGEDVYAYAAAKQGMTGPDARQFGKVLTLALGFGMGALRLIETAETYGLTLTLKQAEMAVSGWRGANDKVVGYWRACESAVKQLLVKNTPGGKMTVGAVQFALAVREGVHQGEWRKELRIRLPSGRQLVYQSPEISVGPMGHSEVTYMGVNQYTKKWERLKTYGGKIVENIVQAVARDVMASAIRSLEKGMWKVLLTVHDELVFLLRPPVLGDRSLEGGRLDVEDARAAILSGLPAWAVGLPTALDGGPVRRYGKT